MFNSGIKANQSFRSNGVYPSPALEPTVVNDKTLYQTNFKAFKQLDIKELYSTRKYDGRNLVKNPVHFTNLALQGSNNVVPSQVTSSVEELDFEDKIAVHSIIGVSDPKTHKPKVIEQKIKKEIKKEKSRATHHETLQRIEPILRETTEVDVQNYYQQHWFSSSLEKFKSEDRSREERIEITRHEFLRHIQQIRRGNVGKSNKMPKWLERRKKEVSSSRRSRSNVLVAPKYCEVQDCDKPALSLANHCSLHILLDTRQVLFEHCTAKFADNTQCSIPVFDITQELPLCPEHARKRENYRLYQEAKPKKIRKKVKPAAMTRPQKRSKKKRKPPATKPPQEPSLNSAILGQNIPISNSELVNEIELDEVDSPELEEDIDQVLALNENGLEQVLANQAHLLEESDEINNVLSTITVDEFTDFFGINRNGEPSLPSREEAEELEKALAAVNDDVKTLEKLSLATPGLLDSLLDEHALADTLVQIPDMFHNGYNSCGDNMVVQTSSFLLPVEPHSHS